MLHCIIQILITNEEMFVFDITYRESVETEVATDLHKEVSVKTAGDSVKIPEVSVKIPEASVKTVLPNLLMQTFKDKYSFSSYPIPFDY